MDGRWLPKCAALAAIVPAAANAQVNPGSLERTVPRPPEIRQPEMPSVVPEAPPPETDARIGETFILGAVQVEGSTVYDSARLGGIFEPFLASEVDQGALDRIVAAITDLYRRDGYFLSYALVPEQSVRSGVVRLQVVEGFVDEIRVEGASGSLAEAVRGVARAVVADRPLRNSTLERAIALIGELPGVVVTDTRLSRDPGQTGSHQLTIVVAPDRAGLFAFIDNRGTVEGARLRNYVAANLRSLAVPGDQMQIEAFVIPGGDFHFIYGKARHSVPIGDAGLRLSLSGAAGRTLQRLQQSQRGRLSQLIAALSYPFVSSRDLSVVGHVSVEDWRSRERIGGLVSQRDSQQVARIAGTVARPAPARLDLRLGLSRGLDGRSPSGDPPLSRPGADRHFTKFNADASVVAPVRDDMSIRIDLTGQYSPDALIVPEEFALGGRIGRAFDFNTATGDSGIGALGELSYRPGELASWVERFELFAYLDGGWAWRNRTPAAAARKQWLAGAGGGARFTISGIHMSGEIGAPIASSFDRHEIRAFFSAARQF